MSDKHTPAKLAWVNPREIGPSKDNPRSDDFYKDKDFLRLKESVAQHGVIVPAIVKRLTKKAAGIKYELIDGERRWKAAIDTNVSEIPVYIWPLEKHIDVLETMFQIHMNQEGWEAIEQAKALEKIFAALKTDIECAHRSKEEIEKELVKQLMEITGMDEETAWSRIRFFRWPKDLREHIYSEPSKSYYSYAVEIEEKIVEPAIRNFPDITDKISPDEIRKALFAKATEGYVRRAMEIREAGILAKRRSDKKDMNKAKNLLLQFIKDVSFTFPEAREQYFLLFPEEAQKPPFSTRKLINTIRTIAKVLKEYTEVSIKQLKPTQKKSLQSALHELSSVVSSFLNRFKQ